MFFLLFKKPLCFCGRIRFLFSLLFNQPRFFRLFLPDKSLFFCEHICVSLSFIFKRSLFFFDLKQLILFCDQLRVPFSFLLKQLFLLCDHLSAPFYFLLKQLFTFHNNLRAPFPFLFKQFFSSSDDLRLPLALKFKQLGLLQKPIELLNQPIIFLVLILLLFSLLLEQLHSNLCLLRLFNMFLLRHFLALIVFFVLLFLLYNLHFDIFIFFSKVFLQSFFYGLSLTTSFVNYALWFYLVNRFGCFSRFNCFGAYLTAHLYVFCVKNQKKLNAIKSNFYSAKMGSL